MSPMTPPSGDRPISVTELFTIGIGPSSSHTVGPMRAALAFAAMALEDGLPQTLNCDLYGSLALTGKGHATDMAVLLGLAGWSPETVDPDAFPGLVETIETTGRLVLDGRMEIAFTPDNLKFRRGEFLPGHPNALTFRATYDDGRALEKTFYSVGGGTIRQADAPTLQTNLVLPLPFASSKDLLAIGAEKGLTLGEIMLANEAAFRPEAETQAFLDKVRDAMLAVIDRGCQQEGLLPGGLKVPRRAHGLYLSLQSRPAPAEPSAIFEWLSLYALAVNEENAAGGRVVTAPTNGAAGILPAVLKYYETFTPKPSRAGSRTLLMTAAIIGVLYKMRASISAAEMGCQGEIGVACSMAAAGLTAALGGSNAQVENAAEIGMEHNLGLTCDPIGGLVQIPCIERNTMGAVKAVNAAYLALQGDGNHLVSLDAVIETMRQTGVDMASKYKETSLGGLAVNQVAC